MLAVGTRHDCCSFCTCSSSSSSCCCCCCCCRVLLLPLPPRHQPSIWCSAGHPLLPPPACHLLQARGVCVLLLLAKLRLPRQAAGGHLLPQQAGSRQQQQVIKKYIARKQVAKSGCLLAARHWYSWAIILWVASIRLQSSCWYGPRNPDNDASIAFAAVLVVAWPQPPWLCCCLRPCCTC
jgi:hypothetical protein